MTGGKAVCQVTYNIWSIDSSNAIIQFTRICASLMGVTPLIHSIVYKNKIFSGLFPNFFI